MEENTNCECPIPSCFLDGLTLDLCRSGVGGFGEFLAAPQRTRKRHNDRSLTSSDVSP